MTVKKILVVEDDVELSASICEYLELEGYNVAAETNGALACDRILNSQPDLVILDVMLPGKDGISVCREVRSSYHGYIVMFTAKEDEIDQIVGLELGADDYLFKPIKPRLLLAKIKSFLRRDIPTLAEAVVGPLNFGSLSIDLEARAVTLLSEDVSLTTAEYEMLRLLASSAGEILSRDDISRELKGNEYDGLERSIDNKISQLRRKLGDNPRQPSKIKTVRSKGYIFMPGAWE